MTTHKETRQECGHTTLWQKDHTPKVGERVYCERCGVMRLVIVIPGGWHAACIDTGCKFRLSRERVTTLRKWIAEHLTLFPEHSVQLENYDKSISVVLRSRRDNAVSEDDAQLQIGLSTPTDGR